MLPLLYIVRMDVEPAYLPEFVSWYDTRHAPDLIRAGFHSCHAYHSCELAPFICNVYEIPSLEIFSSDAYVQVRHDDRQLTEQVLHKISNHSNTIFAQDVVVGIPARAFEPDARPSRSGAVTAPVITTVRFDIDESRAEDLKTWFRDVEANAQSRRPGWLRSRLAHQSGKHPMFPSKQAQWQVLTEWASLDGARSEGAAEQVVERYSLAFGGAIRNAQHHVAALNATLLNSNSWTV
ncbi:hypothetical protein [Steroidobacter sp.]|uniref:hypothetical protein n=1 Tax=Steroidobacter sp. TaxID=1978227 RepID=UPI001A3E3B34|nr:hypothetical protein [Steroidobacter sp.]MBL8269921.1 hypothetical protein [Steroidobacter sp.]